VTKLEGKYTINNFSDMSKTYTRLFTRHVCLLPSEADRENSRSIIRVERLADIASLAEGEFFLPRFSEAKMLI